MIEFEKPKIIKFDETEFYGKFVVEPLERGYGTTLGNSLRRVLLSSLPGSAVTSIQIEGVQHEFAKSLVYVKMWSKSSLLLKDLRSNLTLKMKNKLSLTLLDL